MKNIIKKEFSEAEMEAKAVDIYTKNLEYLQKNQKKVYDKLAAFDSAVEQGHYQNRYDLILKEGYFDVLEFDSGNYLYASSSSEYANSASESIDFEKNSNAFETFKHVHIQDELLDKYAEVEVCDNNLSALAPLINFVDKNSSASSTLKRVEKFVFFGVGLGTHLMSIDKKISAKVYFIVENDLELFKLSLFTTPYFELAQSAKLIFSVFTQTKEFGEDAKEFLDCEFWHNHYIKYFQMLSHSEDKLREFHIKVASQTHNLFYYSDILKQYTTPLKYLKGGYNFLNIVKLHSGSYFTSKPVLLIAAGPSLAKEIKWLKKNHKRFTLVVLSATLSILEKNNISPDIVTHIDGLSNATAHFKKLKSMEFLKDTIFLFSAKTAGDVVQRLNKENLFFFENGTSYKKDFGSITAPCVGSTTFLLMLLFNVKELYLLGLDLALDSKTGATHSEGHEYAKSLDLNSMDEDNISYKKSVIKCSGNFDKEVYTTPEYKFSIDSINSSCVNFKAEDQNIYNLSKGARFVNARPLNADMVKTESLTELDKQALRAEIKGLFLTNSSNKMSKDELNSLSKKREHALKIREIIKVQEMRSFTTDEEFLDSLVSLYEQLAVSSSMIDYDLSLVYENYFKFIYTFIFDFFNRSNLESLDVNIKELNKMLSMQLLRLVNYYERVL